ncbi:hypothetical protein [Vibrio owensii]|uniref:hypothetical protein n=1 Tax=Vibrio owensii TaxID=696485 RepID=UPI003CC51A55
MTTFTSLQRVHANDIITASNNLEIVMDYTTHGNWGVATKCLLDEWAKYHTVLESIKPESVGDELYKLVEKQIEVAVDTIGELELDTVFDDTLKACIARKQSALEFVQKLKPELLNEYTITETELADTIQAMDEFILMAQQKPAKFTNKAMKDEREFYAEVAQVIADQSDISSLNLGNLIKQSTSNPAAIIPQMSLRYQHARQIIIEKHELDIDSQYDEHAASIDQSLLLTTNKDAISHALGNSESIKGGTDELPVIEVPYYSDISIHANNYKDIIQTELQNIRLAVGGNTLIKEQVDELVTDVNYACKIIDEMVEDADYLYDKRNELQSICQFSLEDSAVYSDSNTDWYINFFDEGTEEFDTAKQTAEECISEANRLDSNVRIFNETVFDIKHSFKRLEEKIGEVLNTNLSKEAELAI